MCGGAMKVQKSRRRLGRTLSYGQFEATETIYVCAGQCLRATGVQVTKRSDRLVESLLPGSSFGYDVMVQIGLDRFLRQKQREDIQGSLQDQGIPISTGQVSVLARTFTRYLGRLHRARAEQIKAVLESDGGWPLHLDATGESGRGTMLVVIAGWRRWVLGSWKITTERTDLILPCLLETVRHFGAPCAAMRDLSRAMTLSLNTLVGELNLDIPVLACHQHFLADVGNDLLDPLHAQLRGLFRRTKVLSKTYKIVREIGLQLGANLERARRAVVQWQSLDDNDHRFESGLEGLATVRAIGQWVLDFKARATGLDFPFDRPYLDAYDRCVVALRATNTHLRTPPRDKKVFRALRRLNRYLQATKAEVPFRLVTRNLRRRAELFDELRGVLRCSSTIADDQTLDDLSNMQKNLDDFINSLRHRRPSRGPAKDTREAIDLILDHLDKHGPHIWGHAVELPEKAGGDVRLVARTNCLAEQFFAELKHDERRRSGRKNLGQDLEHMPAEAAIVRNLLHDDYVATVCGSLDNLHRDFAAMDRRERDTKDSGIATTTLGQLRDAAPQLASASLSKQDRRIVRNERMEHRIRAAARYRAS